jgi:tetratricopeptide (TPR) repeat protein
LTGALASVYLARGKLSEAVRLWTALAARQPSNLSVRLVLFDSAVASDQKAAARWLAEIKRIEGDEGTWWRCSEASLELARARQGDKSGLDRAIERLEEVARRRPGWLRLLVLEAQIQDLRGRHDEALEKYARAVKEGERQPAVVARLAVLLAERGRFSEVDQLLQQTQATQGTDAFLGVAAQAALSIGDSQRALELAERGAESRPDDPNSHVWLGLTLWAAGQPRDAEAELRQAARQGPDNPETWVALVSFLAGAGQSTQAESILEEAQGKLPTHLVAATAGRCWEVLGRADRAEQAYQKSAGLPGGTRRLAAFYLRRGEGAKAAPHLERLIGSRSEDAPWARRNLATLLAMRGDHSSFLRGIELLDENRSAGQPESIADTRVRVRLLATRSSGRRRSITLLENLAQARSAAPEDLFLLVQLLESRGDIREADKRMATLLEGGGDQRLYLAHAARSAFRRKDVPKARWWTDQLEQRYAGSWEAIEMTARVLHSEGNAEEAVARVAKAVADHREWAVLAGGLFEELNLIGPAARMYRRDASFAQPETVLRFALFLGRQGRVREALDLCGDVQESGSVEAAARVSVAVLRLGAKALDQTDRAAQIGRVEAWLDQALASKPAPALLLAQVDLFDLLERFDDAEKSYRRLLKMDPDNVTALNNLAFLLARRGKAAEALPLVERAIKVGGPESSLLDTRGMVRLAAGQAEESARDFTAAIEQQPAASFYLHLALARQGKARQSALKEAQTRGLTPESLHPLEKPLYRELIATAKGRADSGSRFRK